MRRVYSSHNLAAVHHARNLLAAEGIASVVRNEFLSSAMGELPPAECQIELWLLNDSDLWRAERALRPAPALQALWRCVNCSEQAEPQFTQCWRCGSYRSAE
jgi:hypothetical protein